MNLKSILAGAAAGALVFFGLSALKAQAVLTVKEYHSSPRTYVGTQVQITGLAHNIRTATRRYRGQDVPYVYLDLYEQDAKGDRGKYYVWCAIPASQLKNQINEGDSAQVTGTMKWPYQVGMIDEMSKN